MPSAAVAAELHRLDHRVRAITDALDALLEQAGERLLGVAIHPVLEAAILSYATEIAKLRTELLDVRQ